MKSKLSSSIALIAAIILVYGVTMLATAAPGTQDNPFITMNYLENIFLTQIIDELKQTEKELTEVFDAKITELESKLAESQGGTIELPSDTDKFTVVTLSSGQSLTCSVGAEIMLRIGSASAVGNAPALVNYTSGNTLSEGEPLVVNNMYLVTIESNGIKATAETVRVLIRGTYSIV
ncbi:MAG: hypothetical protein FWG88_08805 [Oscillospiraceae bacterium]|nr:hypothetical protein [Oscillospiraceae bacterium]